MRTYVPILLVVGLWLAVAGGAAPAAAHPLTHEAQPRVLNLQPRPGEVVRRDSLRAGQVEIGALAVANADIATWSVVVDGVRVRSASTGGDHARIGALVAADPGEHTVTILARDAAGAIAERTWRFRIGSFETRRLAGADRVSSAAAISRDLYPIAAGAAVLADADTYADALAGAPLAAAVDGPLLLTSGDELSYYASEELERLLDPGDTVYLLGGPSGLSPGIETELRDLGFVPERVGGEDRYATAAAIAARLPASDTMIVVSGESFAEGFAAASPAARLGLPILLTPADHLAEATRAQLAAGEVRRVIVVGGEDVVGPGVEPALREVVAEVERVGGATAYETAAAVATRFWADGAAQVALTSGEQFADGIAGARHAAALGVPVLLGTPAGLPESTLGAVRALGAAGAVLYGGVAAVGDRAVDDLNRSEIPAGGPAPAEITPSAGEFVPALDRIVLTFDRDVDLARSTLYVTVGTAVARQEVGGTLVPGDFRRTVVFTVDELPPPLERRSQYPVEVSGLIADGDGVTWVEHRFTLLGTDLARGDRGPNVAELQQRLTDAGYWLGPVTGEFNALTHQALIAFQKVHGLPPDGAYDGLSREVLESNPPRTTGRSATGLVVEVDKPRQLLLLVRDGRVEWVLNTSTGTEEPYEYEGETYVADTPAGQWRIDRQVDGVRESYLGRLYRPKYFHPDGIAIHGSNSVPPYADSHGCVRVTDAAMDWLWEADRVPIGTPVWIY